MNYQQWMATVPAAITGDALWKMEIYRVSLFACDVSWKDVTRLAQDRRTLDLSGQLYRAVGSVSANFAEGYSRSSHKDQVRFYEYSLGSARESRNWYFTGRHVLGETVAVHRIQLFTQIIRHLLTIIPAERGFELHDAPAAYLESWPMPEMEQLLASIPNTPQMLDATRNTQHA
ncbi:MAG TPA: four helix bundle protein [Verrucomicrobiota bacterium]|nr:four helix bundle protein [Verrucomicrobiota bacterium]